MDLSENKGVIYRHPWELSRTDVILKNLSDLDICGDILDVGCGDSYFDEKLIKTFPTINNLYGIDINLEKPFENGKAHYVNSYDDLKDKKFDFILLMDVIEHIEDDNQFIKEIKTYLKKDGIILITVPAFQSLYSIHDEELKHFRRYNFKQLKKILTNNNIKILDWSYFYFSLFIARILTKNKSIKVNTWKSKENALSTKILRFILNLDYTLLRILSKLHIHINGLSLMVICKQK